MSEHDEPKTALTRLLAQHRPNVVTEQVGNPENPGDERDLVWRTRIKCDGEDCTFYTEGPRYWDVVKQHDAHLADVLLAEGYTTSPAPEATETVAPPRMTARQEAHWPAAVERLQRSVEHHSLPTDPSSWTVHFAEKTRPGRGHAVDATYVDGEVFAQIQMDVYGYPSASVATLDWVHADSNEECECPPCEVDRAADEHEEGP